MTWRPSRFVLAYLALAPLYLAPLLVTRFIPAFDLPHHLAIVDALTKAADPDSPYARDFIVNLELVPFAMHYVVLSALAVFVPVNVAIKVLVGAVVLALPLVTARLLVVSGRGTFPALSAFALAYSMPLHHGLIAFVVAMPWLLWMLAEASNEKGWRERPVATAALFSALSMLTFFAHLEAWAVGVAAAAAAVLLCSVPWRTRAIGLASLAPSLLLCGLFIARTRSDPTFAGEPSLPRAVIHARVLEFMTDGVLADLWGRVLVAPIHLLRGFTDGSDVVASHVFFGLIAAGMLGGVVQWARRPARALPRLRPAGALVVVVLIAYFGLPHHVHHAFSIYPRFAVVLALLLLATLPSLSAWPARARNGVVALVIVLLSIHGLDLIRHYAAFNRELADFQEVVATTPAGLRSGGLVFDAESRVMDVGGIFTGIPVYYVMERPAPQSSTWLYYCEDPQVPCRRRYPDRDPLLPHFGYPAEFDAGRALADLELLFVRDGPPADMIFGRELSRVRLLTERGHWRAFIRN